ncbi:MAG TPA: NnrU family protein [Anaeromyxobacter sp.]|nr:NnrU family protein [Anaeromyxobacter sp.]
MSAHRWLRAWIVLVFAGWLIGPFLAAGRVTWLRGWAHLVLLAACLAAHRAFVVRRNPPLVRRRARVGAGSKRWDLWWNALYWPLFAATAVLAGLGVRRGASSPTWTWPAGAALLVLGLGLSAAAMAVNPFFEGTVRIQLEEGQWPVDAGPYRCIRHPGYAGLLLWALATPLLLGSLFAFLPAAATAAWVVLRTALEDRVLVRELAGYADYARRVPRRLVPGVW